jgi:hypothetical protein
MCMRIMPRARPKFWIEPTVELHANYGLRPSGSPRLEVGRGTRE